MSCIAKSQRITKCVLLSLLCFDTVFAAATEAVWKFNHDEDKGIYDKDEVILRYDDHDNFPKSFPGPYIFAIIPVFGFIFICTCCCICIKWAKRSDSISADTFTTVHPPPVSRGDLYAQVHRPPTAPISNDHVIYGTTGETVSFINFTNPSYPLVERQPANITQEMPPDYSTVILNDIINPNQSAFPAVQKDTEKPPPAY